MKILLIAYYYPPINTGGTFRPLKALKYLTALGHDVTVLTHSYKATDLYSESPSVIRVKDISHNRIREPFYNKLKWLVLRLYTELLNKLGRYHSIYSWWKGAVIKNASTIVAQVQPDVIICTYPPVETLELGQFFQREYGIPMVSDFRDGLLFEPVEARRMGKYRCIRDHYQSVEEAAVEQSAAVTAVTVPISRYFHSRYPGLRVVTVPNGYDPDDFLSLPDDVGLDETCINIVYTGRFSLSDKDTSMDVFFNALRRLLEKKIPGSEKIKVHLVGEFLPEEQKNLADLVKNGAAVFHGMVAHPRSLAFQAAANLLLITAHPGRSSVATTKIFEYLYSGKPILALTQQTVLEEIVRNTKAGWIIAPQEEDEVYRFLEGIVSKPDFYCQISPDTDMLASYSVGAGMHALDGLLKRVKTER